MHFFMKRLHDAIFVNFHYPAGRRRWRRKGHHGNLRPGQPGLMGTDIRCKIGQAKIIRVNQHHRFVTDKIPVLKQCPACPQNVLFVNSANTPGKGTLIKPLRHYRRKVMEIDQNFINSRIGQGQKPVFNERAPVNGKQALRNKVGNRP